LERVKGIEPDFPQAQSYEIQPVRSSAEAGYKQIRAQIEKPLEPDLQKVVVAWPLLSAPLKAAVLALIGAAGAAKEGAQ